MWGLQRLPSDHDLSAPLVIGQGKCTPQQKAKCYLQEYLATSLYNIPGPSHVLLCLSINSLSPSVKLAHSSQKEGDTAGNGRGLKKCTSTAQNPRLTSLYAHSLIMDTFIQFLLRMHLLLCPYLILFRNICMAPRHYFVTITMIISIIANN